MLCDFSGAQRRKAYMKYGDRVAQPEKVQSAKSVARVSGSTGEQGNTLQRRFAAFDIDGTLVRWQLYHAIADKLVKLGHVPDEVFEPIREARMSWKRREKDTSYKDYERQLVGLYDQILQTLSVEQFNEAAADVFEEYKDQVHIYTRDLIKDLKSKNYLLFAISGSQTEIVAMVADYYGFDDYSGTTYVQNNGKFTGESTYRAGDKVKVLKEFIEKHQATFVGSIAVGDSAGDISMLEVVEKPIAFNPEGELANHAIQEGWPIVVERKGVNYTLEHIDDRYVVAKTNIW